MNRAAIDVRVFLQATSVALGLLSAWFLGRGGFGLTPDIIAEVASTEFDYNPHVVESLAAQAADTRVGTLLVVLSVLVQLWSLAPHSARSASAKRNAIVLALLLCFAIGFAAHFYSATAAHGTVERTRTILEQPSTP